MNILQGTGVRVDVVLVTCWMTGRIIYYSLTSGRIYILMP